MDLIDHESINLADRIQLIENRYKAWTANDLLRCSVDELVAHLPDLIVNIAYPFLAFDCVLVPAIRQSDRLNAKPKNEVEVVFNK